MHSDVRRNISEESQPVTVIGMKVLRHLALGSHPPSAVCIGNFDGVHLGHQEMLLRLRLAAEARALCSVAMTFEPHPREYFTPLSAPGRLTAFRDKVLLVCEHQLDEMLVYRFDRALSSLSADEFVRDVLCRLLNVRFLLIGDDFRFGVNRSGDIERLRRLAGPLGFEVESIQPVLFDSRRISSTAIREALARGDLGEARALLGRQYAISGRVVHGKKLGRTLGFPTANIRLGPRAPALMGVYAVKLYGVRSNPLPGVASLGVRPTLESAGAPSLEVYLFDFSDDIYGRHVRVEFVQKLRDEVKFDDVDTMCKQMSKDVADARAVLLSGTQLLTS